MELTEDLMRRNTVCCKAEEKKAELFPTKGEKISKVRGGRETREGITVVYTHACT
jgi:hypothetical protein